MNIICLLRDRGIGLITRESFVVTWIRLDPGWELYFLMTSYHLALSIWILASLATVGFASLCASHFASLYIYVSHVPQSEAHSNMPFSDSPY